ncbi:helix-turn-helix domain-containing protein [Lentzea atacamensis]|uniref:helix-turn-helix domain-containing protein n=1 Tax=Lentzea atacamensis TaxID=531938 RepID=UPI0039893736
MRTTGCSWTRSARGGSGVSARPREAFGVCGQSTDRKFDFPSDDAQHDLDDLGALLRTHRKRAGLTGVEAARRAGFTRSPSVQG